MSSKPFSHFTYFIEAYCRIVHAAELRLVLKLFSAVKLCLCAQCECCEWSICAPKRIYAAFLPQIIQDCETSLGLKKEKWLNYCKSLLFSLTADSTESV